MKKTIAFFIIMILGTLVAAYFTLERSESFKDEQVLRLEYKEKKERFIELWGDTRARNKGHEDVLTQLIQNREVLKATIASMRVKAKQMNVEIAKADRVIQAHEAQLAAMRKKREEVETMLKKFGSGINFDNLAATVDDTEEEKAARVKDLNELEVLLASAKKSLADNQAELVRMDQREADRVARVRTGSMEVDIVGVNHDWGFLVIGAGSDTGFTPQSSLIVERNGRMIGRVRPSSIEANQTLAEISYDTMAPGVRFQVGDKVIFPVATSN